MNNVNIFDFPYNNLYSMRNIFIEVTMKKIIIP